ncbi:MAG: hypothetical protein HUU31_13165 [Anaerolineae bacterium]|nr:hypothetical protein [Anaerolineae bacterium]
MYGCMSYQAPVMLADGSKRTIGEIVNQQQPVDVMTYNVETRAFEPKPVINWFKNGIPVEQFNMTDSEIGRLEQEYLTFITSYPDGSGHRRVTTTPNHEIATPNGFQMAEDIDLGEYIIGRVEARHVEMELAGATVGGNVYSDVSLLPAESFAAMPLQVIEIRRTLFRGEEAVRYNLQVADNANFLVSDVVVHNSPETQPGGRALKFYASVRLDVRKLESIKGSSDEVLGSRVRVRVTKNKIAPPFREAEFDIMFLEGGISKSGEVLDLATDLGIIEKRGAFYRYNDGLLGQGRENAKGYLLENRGIRDEIENKVRAHYGLPVLAT